MLQLELLPCSVWFPGNVFSEVFFWEKRAMPKNTGWGCFPSTHTRTLSWGCFPQHTQWAEAASLALRLSPAPFLLPLSFFFLPPFLSPPFCIAQPTAEGELVSFHGWVTHWHVVASSSSLWFGCSDARKSETPTPWFMPSRLDERAKECRDQHHWFIVSRGKPCPFAHPFQVFPCFFLHSATFIDKMAPDTACIPCDC